MEYIIKIEINKNCLFVKSYDKSGKTDDLFVKTTLNANMARKFISRKSAIAIAERISKNFNVCAIVQVYSKRNGGYINWQQ